MGRRGCIEISCLEAVNAHRASNIVIHLKMEDTTDLLSYCVYSATKQFLYCYGLKLLKLRANNYGQ